MGWIKLDRKITEHWIWQKKPFSEGQAWIDLIMLANHDKSKFMYKGQLVQGERGTVYRSMLFLAERWGWSRGKVKRFLSVLQNDGMVIVNATTHDTTISLINYALFQDRRATKRTTDGQQTNNKRTTDGHIQEEYKKEYKKDKEGDCVADCPSGEVFMDDMSRYYASGER